MRNRLRAELLLVVTPFVLLSPLLFTGKAMFWGTPALQFIPWRMFAWETLLSGQMPLWNPWLGMGAPLVANYQSALFYPPNWTVFLLAAGWGLQGLAWGHTLLVALHLGWASLGMARLGERLGFNPLARIVSGLAFGLSGYLVARAGFFSINATVAWLPWVIASLEDRGPGGSHQPYRHWLRSVIPLAMLLLAGHAQTAWYTLLLAGMWLLCRSWRAIRMSRAGKPPATVYEPLVARFRTGIWQVIGALSRLGLALTMAAGVAAIQLLPTFEYLRQSQRASEVAYEYAMTYSFWPWRLLAFLAPDLYGNPARDNFWGYGNYWEDAGYIGFLPVILALFVIIHWAGAWLKSRIQPDRSPRASTLELPQSLNLVPFTFCLILVSLLLALGKNTPVFPWLYRNVPSFDMFQAPTRFSIWAIFGLSLLAGLGIQGWRRPVARALYWTRLATAGAFAASLGAGLAWFLLGDVSPSFIRATALAGVWGLGAGFLSLNAPRTATSKSQEPGIRKTDRLWSGLVVAWIALDLLVAGWGLNPGVDLSFYSGDSAAPAGIRADLAGRRVYLSAQDEYELMYKRFLRFSSFAANGEWRGMRAVLLPNLNMLDHIASVSNFDPLVDGRYARWMQALEVLPAGERQKRLNLMGVGVVEIMDTDGEFGVQFVQQSQDFGARARWFNCAIPAGDATTAWEHISGAQVDLESQVVLEGLDVSTSGECSHNEEPPRIRFRSETPNRLVLEVNSDAPGWLMLADTWYPGWTAHLDGQMVRIYRADYLFRAVRIEAGEHLLVFEYRPLSFWVGLITSLLACALLTLLWVRK